MNAIKLIKEFLEYKRSLRNHSIDITPDNKRKLVAFDYSVAENIFNITLDRLSKEMISGELSPDYVRGAKFALLHFKKHFRD